ncbi:peptidoglycan amidohydrolase family protein [Schleiferilactobacillus perolens]|nr:peptidoglycan amidohydrolase family protein [Schleiferilactobacillus perolens]MCI2172173.1 NlpC/P60 family protein [Schleiferilactobacillus perolens]
MSFSIDAAIAYMYQLQKNGVTYSMDGSRTGTDGTADCSGAVYAALRAGGMPSAGYVLNTESMHNWLLANGWQRIADNSNWNAQRGDVFIWGKIGDSAGAGGHTGIFIDHDNIIHCNYAHNGVSINNHDAYWAADGCPYFYAYRYASTQEAHQGDNDMNLSKLTGLIPVTAYGLAWITNPNGAVLYDYNHKATGRKLSYGTSWVVTGLDKGWLKVGGLINPDDAIVKINKGIVAGDWTGQNVQVVTNDAYTQAVPKPKQAGIKYLPVGSRWQVSTVSSDGGFVKIGGWIDANKVKVEL